MHIVELTSGGASLGPRGALAPLANENFHYVNSKMATVYYCSKRVTPPHLSKIQGQAPPLQVICQQGLQKVLHALGCFKSRSVL